MFYTPAGLVLRYLLPFQLKNVCRRGRCPRCLGYDLLLREMGMSVSMRMSVWLSRSGNYYRGGHHSQCGKPHGG